MTVEELLAGCTPSAARPVVVLTGAGVSVSSGIPTFRGPEGYWTVGSTQYRPQQMATNQAFQQMPREVWRWYLYRKGVCNAADPNDGHRSIAALETHFGDGFALITQNVDGLHTRGGCSHERTYEVHGSIDWMRDLDTDERLPIPDGLALTGRDDPLTDEAWAQLVNPATGARCRPHVLWFDEYYDERNYRAHSAMEAATRASVMIVCGTSGAASLPYQAVEMACAAGAALVDISPDDNPFRDAAERYERGVGLEATGDEGLARVVAALGVQ
ncbi:MAG: RNA polymerase subunit sigma [Myxococcales bacterium]|nr:RNA polymerase subunit sigma [Myxococcales bacterium]